MKKAITVYDICSISPVQEDDIIINRFAPYLATHPNLLRTHGHNFYHLVLFTEGGGTHTIDFEKYSVNSMQIYFMSPGQVHGWEFEGQVDGYVINFSARYFQSLLLRPDYLEQFPFFNGQPAVIDLPDHLYDDVKQIFEKLISETDVKQSLRDDMIKALMLQLFITVGRVSAGILRPLTSSYSYTLLKNFQKLVELNFLTLRLPRAYGELLFVTPNHLNGVCKSLLGTAAGDLIRNRVVLEAKRRLASSSDGIAQIAIDLNFTDIPNFTKFFKKVVGLTPDSFRKDIRMKAL